MVEAGRSHPVMTGWLHAVLLAGAVFTAAPVSTAVRPNAEATHDFHVSYTRMAVEPTVISAQIRVFSDDITQALIERSKATSITLGSPQAEAAFGAYLAEHFPVTVNGRRLVPVVASGSQDSQMWSYIVTWTSPVPITSVTMHNATMMELFGDQQNIVKIKHLASGKEATLFYSGGSKADQVFRF